MAILEQSPNHSLVEQLIKMRERIYDFPQHALLPLLKWEKMFWQEHRHLVEILKNGTPIEFGRYMRDVHWKVQGREEYWETLLSVRPGTVKQYFERRRAYCEQERENSL